MKHLSQCTGCREFKMYSSLHSRMLQVCTRQSSTVKGMKILQCNYCPHGWFVTTELTYKTILSLSLPFVFHAAPYAQHTSSFNIFLADASLLGSNITWTYRQTSTFQRNILSPSSALKMERVCLSEMLVPTYMSTWHCYPKDQQ
jgi:hypothetical protein